MEWILFEMLVLYRRLTQTHADGRFAIIFLPEGHPDFRQSGLTRKNVCVYLRQSAVNLFFLVLYRRSTLNYTDKFLVFFGHGSSRIDTDYAFFFAEGDTDNIFIRVHLCSSACPTCPMESLLPLFHRDEIVVAFISSGCPIILFWQVVF